MLAIHSDHNRVSQIIEQACTMISHGEKDELRIYLLAFRLHALQGET